MEQRITIVDDEGEVRSALRRLFKVAGMKTQSYASAEDFLDDPSGRRCDCLILDNGLPGRSGLETAESAGCQPSTASHNFCLSSGRCPHKSAGHAGRRARFLREAVQRRGSAANCSNGTAVGRILGTGGGQWYERIV